jgi:hypothetical protein
MDNDTILLVGFPAVLPRMELLFQPHCDVVVDDDDDIQ